MALARSHLLHSASISPEDGMCNGVSTSSLANMSHPLRRIFLGAYGYERTSRNSLRLDLSQLEMSCANPIRIDDTECAVLACWRRWEPCGKRGVAELGAVRSDAVRGHCGSDATIVTITFGTCLRVCGASRSLQFL